MVKVVPALIPIIPDTALTAKLVLAFKFIAPVLLIIDTSPLVTKS